MNMRAPAQGGICSMYCIQRDVDVCSKTLTWESCDRDEKCTKHRFDNKTFVNDVVSRIFCVEDVEIRKNDAVDLSDNNITCTVSYYGSPSKMFYITVEPPYSGHAFKWSPLNSRHLFQKTIIFSYSQILMFQTSQ